MENEAPRELEIPAPVSRQAQRPFFEGDDLLAVVPAVLVGLVAEVSEEPLLLVARRPASAQLRRSPQPGDRLPDRFVPQEASGVAEELRMERFAGPLERRARERLSRVEKHGEAQVAFGGVELPRREMSGPRLVGSDP